MTDPFGLPLIAKATLVLLLALGTIIAMRRARAARRALVLAAAFAVLLALPAASLVAPPVGIDIPVPPVSLSLRPRAGVVPVDATAPRHPVSAATAERAASFEAPQRSPLLHVPAMLRAAWAAGVTLVLVPFVVALWRLRTLARTALPWSEGTTLVARLRLESGIRRDIEVGVHEDVHTPLTFGLLRPSVLLPPDARNWTEHDLRRALVHELEHIRRLDWLVYVVARAACALYWFHPLVWIAWRRLCLDTERACDDAVLGRSEGDMYARQLVLLAQRLSAASHPIVSMASPTDLGARVRAILNLHQARGRAGSAAVAGVACSACLLLVLIGPLQATVPVDVANDAPAASVQSTPRAIPDSPALSAVAIPASHVRVPGAVAPSLVGPIRRSASAHPSPPGYGGAIERLVEESRLTTAAVPVGVTGAAQAAQPAAPLARGVIGVAPCSGFSLYAPAALPPAGSPPFLWLVDLCFVRQGGVTRVPPEAYLSRMQLRPSRPSADEYVTWDEAAERQARADQQLLEGEDFVDDLELHIDEHVFPNGVVGVIVSFDILERERR